MFFNIFKKKLLNIIDFEFSEVVKKRTKEDLGITDEKTYNLVEISLKDYFYVLKTNINKDKNFKLDMIDRPADVLWHNFILDTKSYEIFCKNYMGFFVHHYPYAQDKELSLTELTRIEDCYKNIFDIDIFTQNLTLIFQNKKHQEYVEKRKKIIKNNIKITIFENHLPKKHIMLNHQKNVYKNYLSKFNFNSNKNEILFSSLNYHYGLGIFINKFTIEQLEIFIKIDKDCNYKLTEEEMKIIEKPLIFLDKYFFENLEKQDNYNSGKSFVSASIISAVLATEIMYNSERTTDSILSFNIGISSDNVSSTPSIGDGGGGICGCGGGGCGGGA